MTPADLQNKIMERLQEVLKDFPLRTGYNDLAPFKIFKQNVPEQHMDENDYSEDKDSEKALYPFVVVKLSNGLKEENHGTQENVVQLVIGIKNEDLGGKGFDDALAVMEAIMGDFNKDPLIDKRYVAKYPFSWATVEENTYPYYYVGIETMWESHTLINTNPGGFIHG
ncbi:hypothetical protein [Sporosarcina sp. FSL K6-5500]|uniref:hypothetical protein n=1 Tax=Sporosarcina sp. FSL K6-5500 TaxID=2921558 RepID=UPI0030F74870